MQTFKFDDFDREISLPNPEDFQIAENRLFRFRMPIDLDTKEIALILPI